MINTVEFVSECGKFKFTVNAEFFTRHRFYHETERRLMSFDETVKRLSEENVYNLMTKYSLKNYLHNENGPAILYLETGAAAYYKFGEPLSKEEGEKMVYNHQYDNFIDDFILKENENE